jgi:MFS family permease
MQSLDDLLSLRDKLRRIIFLQCLSFAAMGAGNPFQSLYLKHVVRHPDGTPSYNLIGLLLFAQAAAGMVGTPIAGYMADRFKIQNRILFICAIVVVASSLVTAVPALAGDGGRFPLGLIFPIFIVSLTLNGMFFRPISPIIDTETLEYLHEKYGSGDRYGRIRLFGSVSWAVTSILFGFILQRTGLFHLTILGYAAGFAGLAFVAKSGFRARITSVRIPWEHLKKDGMYKAMLFFAFFMGVAINTSFIFTSYLMEDARAGYFEIGLAFGLAALPEIPVMFFSRKIKALVGNRGMIVAGSLVMILKLYFLVQVSHTKATWLFILVHCMHGVGFSLFFLGIIDIMDRRAHEDLRATYQNLFYLVWSFAIACGSLFAGYVIGRYGNTSLMAADGAIAAAALTFFLVFVRGNGPAKKTAPPVEASS